MHFWGKILKHKKHSIRRKQKKSSDKRWKSTAGSDQLQKLEGRRKSLIQRKQKNKLRKRRKHNTKRNLQKRHKPRKQKTQTTTDRNQMHVIWHRTQIRRSKRKLKWVTATYDYLGCFKNKRGFSSVQIKQYWRTEGKHRSDLQHQARDKHRNQGNATEGMRLERW